MSAAPNIVYPDTLNEALAVRADSPQTIGFIGAEGGDFALTVGELFSKARKMLGAFQRAGMKPGSELIVLLNDYPAFLESFWGGLLGGIVPAPVAVGMSPEHRFKLFRIFDELADPWLVTDEKTLSRYRQFAEQHGVAESMARIEARSVLTESAREEIGEGQIQNRAAGDRAFIQFSSGSTGRPKGVVLSHGNLMANIQGIHAAADFKPADRPFSWMPLTHDLGLIGFHLNWIVGGMNHFLMPSDLFARRPLLWLEKAAEHKADILCSPNFGYRHWLRAAEGRSLNLDLSHVRLVFNGAEPISASLCREFLERLASTGLNPAAMYPVYGLAEASLAVSFPKLDSSFRTRIRARESLAPGAEPAAATPEDGIECVSLGKTIPNCELRISDEMGEPVREGVVGHIRIRGANVTQGYYQGDSLDRSGFDAGGWLDTGDLGFLQDGELFVTGRVKDIFFVNGQNFYLHDLEEVVAAETGLGAGKLIATAVRRNNAECDEIAVFVLHRRDLEDFLPTAEKVARTAMDYLGVPLAHVLPIRNIPKTTSGKLQRASMAQRYFSGEFDVVIADIARLSEPNRVSEVDANGLERRLKSICDEVLGDADYRVTDSLFDVCASSLMLAQIHEGIEAAFPGQLDVTDLFDYPTIRELAGHLEQKLVGSEGEAG